MLSAIWLRYALYFQRIPPQGFKMINISTVLCSQRLSAGSILQHKAFTSLSIQEGVNLSLILFWGTNSFTTVQKRSSQLTRFIFTSLLSIAVAHAGFCKVFLSSSKLAFSKFKTYFGLLWIEMLLIFRRKVTLRWSESSNPSLTDKLWTNTTELVSELIQYYWTALFGDVSPR